MFTKCAHCEYSEARPCQTEAEGEACKARRLQQARDVTPVGDIAELGLIQFHSQSALRERFYHVVDDLQAAGCIVDLWLHDIASVMAEHGYEMTVRRVS